MTMNAYAVDIDPGIAVGQLLDGGFFIGQAIIS